MTSEEKLVAQVAKELLEANADVEQTGQIALGTDQEELRMPCTVVSASLTNEQSDGSLPSDYDLTVEHRSIVRVHDETAVDEVFRAIDTALSTTPAVTPPTIASFRDYIIEAQTGSDRDLNEDTLTRSRTYKVFAKLA